MSRSRRPRPARLRELSISSVHPLGRQKQRVGGAGIRPAWPNTGIWIGWRRGGDSNSRYPSRYARFRGGCDRPLCHLTGVLIISFETPALTRQSDNVPFEQSRNVPLTAPSFGDARRTA